MDNLFLRTGSFLLSLNTTSLELQTNFPTLHSFSLKMRYLVPYVVGLWSVTVAAASSNITCASLYMIAVRGTNETTGTESGSIVPYSGSAGVIAADVSCRRRNQVSRNGNFRQELQYFGGRRGYDHGGDG
jgi:hypothetical protein